MLSPRKRRSTFDGLEERVKIHILSFLSLEDLMRVRTCNKSLRTLISTQFRVAIACNAQRQIDFLIEQALRELSVYAELERQLRSQRDPEEQHNQQKKQQVQQQQVQQQQPVPQPHHHRRLVSNRNNYDELLEVLKDVRSTLCQFPLTLDSSTSTTSSSSSLSSFSSLPFSSSSPPASLAGPSPPASPLSAGRDRGGEFTFSSGTHSSSSPPQTPFSSALSSSSSFSRSCPPSSSSLSSSSSLFIHSHRCPYLSAVEFRPNFSVLLSSFSELLLDVARTLKMVKGNQRVFEEASRLMVIVVRRDHDEIMKIFFNANLDLLTAPTLLIQDPQGRRFWQSTFGFRNLVPYEELESKLLQLWSSTSELPARVSLEKLSYALSFFLNFPRNDHVTTYGWDRFLAHWGPFPVLPANLDKFVLSGGFVGLMTGGQAAKLLSSFQEEFVLIRYSHTSIRTLSISYVDNNKIIHERKPTGVDITSFLRAILQKKKLFPLSLVWNKVHQLKTLEDFSHNPYLLRQVMSDTW